MQKRNQSLSLIMCGLMLLSVATGCGSRTGEETRQSGMDPLGVGSAESQTETAAETKPDHLDALGAYDFGGRNFNMLVRETRITDVIAEEETGEVFNDAVYSRNAKVAERFNIVFTTQNLPDDGGTWNKQIGASTMAHDGAYDVVLPDYWWGCETGGYFLNLRDYSSIMDFSKPWWCAGWNDSSEIYGLMYSAVGAMCMDLYSNAICTFFNKEAVESLGMTSPYELVDNGTWTMDTMLEMASRFSGDVNGDGVMDLANDRFGAFYDLQSGRGLFASSGWKTATKTADGGYEYAFWGDDFVNLYDKVYKIINETDYISYCGADAQNAFRSGRLLFFNQGMGVAAYLRDADLDFGIVPYPKYNESQKDYITYNFGTYYMAIPTSASDPTMSAVILEALNAESYNTVKDAYYEVNMKVKFSRNETTRRMLDIIVDTEYFDFTFVNESATDHIVMYFFGEITSKNENIASAYEKRQKSFQNKLEKLFETYREDSGLE